MNLFISDFLVSDPTEVKNKKKITWHGRNDLPDLEWNETQRG